MNKKPQTKGIVELYNPYSWSKRGKKIYGEKQGKRAKRTNLIKAKKGTKRLAPFVFNGSCTTVFVEEVDGETFI
ncbi:MAG: hypothetical protein KAG28_05695 [Cocleimonas sp.]|nr:hypothetical protein [Cocleimonas sp.]